MRRRRYATIPRAFEIKQLTGRSSPFNHAFIAFFFVYATLVGCGQIDIASAERAEECDPQTITQSTDPQIQALSKAASQFLDSLDEATAAQLQYCIGDAEMHSWTNVPGSRSGGIELRQLTQDQQHLAWDLVNSMMSDHGYAKARLIATEITQVARAAPLGSHTVVLFGDPRTNGIWGMQIDGHHLALNFLVYQSELLLAPAFLGTQPRSVNGQAPLKNETMLGHRLVDAFNQQERTTAKQGGQIGNDVIVGSGRSHEDRGRLYDVTQFDGVGMALASLSDSSRVAVEELVDEYVYNLAPPFAGTVRDLIDTDFERGFVTFDTRGEDLYYRVYIPDRMLIEYNDINSTHVHTIFRLLGEQPFTDYGALTAQLTNAPRTIAEHYDLADHHRHDVYKGLALASHQH